MMESRRASLEIDRLRRRTIDRAYHVIALMLDGIERSQDERDSARQTASCLEHCPKAACRRTRRCHESAAPSRRADQPPAIRTVRPSHRSPGTL